MMTLGVPAGTGLVIETKNDRRPKGLTDRESSPGREPCRIPPVRPILLSNRGFGVGAMRRGAAAARGMIATATQKLARARSPQDSSQNVTGPSLTSDTRMSAPKRPVATAGCRAGAAATRPSNSASACTGAAVGTRAGAAPRVGGQRELRHQQRAAAAVDQRADSLAVGRSAGNTR